MTLESSESYNHNRLYRNRRRGLLAGVCAGISDWTGFNLTALRVGAALLAIPFTAVIIIGYLAWRCCCRSPRETAMPTRPTSASGAKPAARRSRA